VSSEGVERVLPGLKIELYLSFNRFARGNARFTGEMGRAKPFYKGPIRGTMYHDIEA
jgi:hypothetical protein